MLLQLFFELSRRTKYLNVNILNLRHKILNILKNALLNVKVLNIDRYIRNIDTKKRIDYYKFKVKKECFLVILKEGYMRYPFGIDGLSSSFDLISVLTHELGHVAGLNHDTSSRSAVMYAEISKGEIRRTFNSQERIYLYNLYH